MSILAVGRRVLMIVIVTMGLVAPLVAGQGGHCAESRGD
jgi:hypothetical protein